MSLINSYPLVKLDAFSSRKNLLPLKKTKFKIVSTNQLQTKTYLLTKPIKQISLPIKRRYTTNHPSTNSTIYFSKIKQKQQMKRNYKQQAKQTRTVKTQPEAQKKLITSPSIIYRKIKLMRNWCGPYSFLSEIRNPFLKIETSFLSQTQKKINRRQKRINTIQCRNHQKTKSDYRNFKKLKYQQIPLSQFIEDSNSQEDQLILKKQNSQLVGKLSTTKERWYNKLRENEYSTGKMLEKFQNRWQYKNNKYQEQSSNYL